MVVTLTVQAGQIEDLERGIALCEKRAELCEMKSKEQHELDKIKTETIKHLSDENVRLRKQKDAWYKSPYLWLTVGVITGVMVTK